MGGGDRQYVNCQELSSRAPVGRRIQTAIYNFVFRQSCVTRVRKRPDVERALHAESSLRSVLTKQSVTSQTLRPLDYFVYGSASAWVGLYEFHTKPTP